MLRIYRPEIVRKIEYVDDDRSYRDLGLLKTDEIWSGSTKTELAQFGFPPLYSSLDWFVEGYAWDPRCDNSPHMATINSEHHRHEAYYSTFQCYELNMLCAQLTLHVQTEFHLDQNGRTQSRSPEWQKEIGYHAERFVQQIREPWMGNIYGPLCQLISDRYYPRTQSDERTIRVKQPYSWDWYEYVRRWQPQEVMDAFEITEGELRRLYERLAREQAHLDPLSAWYKLERFVSVEKRDKLKGDALRAKTMREMALMLKYLFEEVTGRELPDPNETGEPIPGREREDDVQGDLMRRLEYVANAFRVNSRPALTLIVEGETEEAILPRAFECEVGARPERLGIEIASLKGVSNAVGSIKLDRHTAVVRLVDYLHHHQTICVVLLDNENQASKLRKRLRYAKSTYNRGRYTTRLSYVKIWLDNLEFDNFSDTEIAVAMSHLFGSRIFSASEIAPCRIRNGRTSNLEKVYQQKTGVSLRKPALGLALVEAIFAPSTRRKAEGRPLVQLVDRLTRLTSLNHLPVADEVWHVNQLSGYFGRRVR